MSGENSPANGRDHDAGAPRVGALPIGSVHAAVHDDGRGAGASGRTKAVRRVRQKTARPNGLTVDELTEALTHVLSRFTKLPNNYETRLEMARTIRHSLHVWGYSCPPMRIDEGSTHGRYRVVWGEE